MSTIWACGQSFFVVTGSIPVVEAATTGHVAADSDHGGLDAKHGFLSQRQSQNIQLSVEAKAANSNRASFPRIRAAFTRDVISDI